MHLAFVLAAFQAGALLASAAPLPGHDTFTNYQHCTAKYCEEIAGDEELNLYRFLEVPTTNTKKAFENTFSGTKQFVFGSLTENDFQSLALPWVPDRFANRGETVNKEITFSTKTMTLNHVFREGDGDYAKENAASYDVFLTKVPMPICSTDPEREVHEIKIGLRAGFVKDDVSLLVIDKKGMHPVSLEEKELSPEEIDSCMGMSDEEFKEQCLNRYHNYVVDGVTSEFVSYKDHGNTCTCSNEGMDVPVCACTEEGEEDCVSTPGYRNRCPLFSTPASKKSEVNKNNDKIVKSQMILSSDMDTYSIKLGNDQLFGEEEGKVAYFYLAMYVDDKNGAGNDFMADYAAYNKDGVELDRTNCPPHDPLNTFERSCRKPFPKTSFNGLDATFVNNFPDGFEEVDVYYGHNSGTVVDGYDCHEMSNGFTTCGKTDIFHVTRKNDCRFEHTVNAKSERYQPGVFAQVGDCKDIPGIAICNPTGAPTTLSPTTGRPTTPPTSSDRCMRHAIYRKGGRVSEKVGEAYGLLANKNAAGRGRNCMCVSGFQKDPSAAIDGWSFGCVRKPRRGQLFDTFLATDTCFFLIKDQDPDGNAFNWEELNLTAESTIKVLSVESAQGDIFTEGSVLAELQITDGDVVRNVPLKAGSRFNIIGGDVVNTVRLDKKSDLLYALEKKRSWNAATLKKHEVFCAYQTKVLDQTDLSSPSAEDVNYYRCPANHYAVGSQITLQEIEQITCEGKHCGNTNLNRGPFTTGDQYAWWKKSPSAKVGAKTHNIIPKDTDAIDLTYNKCPKGANRFKKFYEAEAICEFHGGRLCSATELFRGVAGNKEFGSGCFFNYDRIWSSTPCGNSGNKFLTVAGGDWWGLTKAQRNDATPKCEKRTTHKAKVRCCMDTAANIWPLCKKCPRYSTAPPGSFLMDSCICTYGRSKATFKCRPPPNKKEL
jgi:hypothetical protein